MEKKGLDFNFFIGVFLIFGILTWFNSTQIEIDSESQNTISLNDISKDQSTLSSKFNEQKKTDSISLELSKEDVQLYELSNNLLNIKISNYGASIEEVVLKDYYTYDSLSLQLIDDLNFNFSFFIKDVLLNTKDIVFTDIIQNKNTLSFYFKDIENNSIAFIYKLLPDSYILNFEVLTENGSSYIEPDKFLWSQKINQLEKNIDNERNSTTINYSVNNKSSKQLSLMKDVEKNIESPIWIANKQQFFSTIIYSENAFKTASLTTFKPEDNRYVKSLNSEFTLNYDNQENQYLFDIYLLPNKYSLLSSFDKGFESLVPLGWGIFGWVNKFLVIPMFNFLENFGLNYGLIILIISLVIKSVLFLPTKS